MTRAEVKNMIEQIGYPYAYGHFAEGEALELPYIIFRYPESDNFSADSKVYLKSDNLDIELYTSKRDFDTEADVEAVLDAKGIFYKKNEMYIESEQMYEILYEMEMIVMG